MDTKLFTSANGKRGYETHYCPSLIIHRLRFLLRTAKQGKYQFVSFELGKTGLIYNLSFDHTLKNKNFGFKISAGSNPGNHLQLITVGAGSYYLIGKQTNLLELGTDLHYLKVNEVSDDQKGFADLVTYPDYSIATLYTSINIGYRRYGKHLLFRAGISPGFIKNGFLPGGYISFGVRF